MSAKRQIHVKRDKHSAFAINRHQVWPLCVKSLLLLFDLDMQFLPGLEDLDRLGARLGRGIE